MFLVAYWSKNIFIPNNFSINGLTIQATSLTGNETVSITTDTDIDGIYKQIKDFFKDYNELIKAMDTAYNADSSKGYEPLTSDEKEAMIDDYHSHNTTQLNVKQVEELLLTLPEVVAELKNA